MFQYASVTEVSIIKEDMMMMTRTKTMMMNRRLWISIAPTKAKSRETPYSQALNHNRIARQAQYPGSQAGKETVNGL